MDAIIKFVPQLASLFQIELFIISIALFITGLILSVVVVKKQFRWLLWYPEWMRRVLKEFLARNPGFFKLFMVIFLINTFSLGFNVLSGFGVVLPGVFAILIGIHVGVIAYQEGGWKAMIMMFLAPHVVFELPAAWLSLALGFRLGLEILTSGGDAQLVFWQSVGIYYRIIVPLLWIAALLEAALISVSLKRSQHSSSFPQQPLEPQ
ncbi:MAG: stage II sporulation protein M [candidate division KSB1 bacterium]|nr:stage II sporulation protein M [candidate division KSB1 bacterium]